MIPEALSNLKSELLVWSPRDLFRRQCKTAYDQIQVRTTNHQYSRQSEQRGMDLGLAKKGFSGKAETAAYTWRMGRIGKVRGHSLLRVQSGKFLSRGREHEKLLSRGNDTWLDDMILLTWKSDRPVPEPSAASHLSDKGCSSPPQLSHLMSYFSPSLVSSDLSSNTWHPSNFHTCFSYPFRYLLESHILSEAFPTATCTIAAHSSQTNSSFSPPLTSLTSPYLPFPALFFPQHLPHSPRLYHLFIL